MPGKYAVRLTVGSWTSTQPLTLIEDPRITADGVTTADLREQFEHNMRVRDLVSEVNQLVARVRAAEQSLKGKPDSAAQLDSIESLASHLITPAIRYSKPELQTHITYLYQMTNCADEKIGRRCAERLSGVAQGTGSAEGGSWISCWGRRSKAAWRPERDPASAGDPFDPSYSGEQDALIGHTRHFKIMPCPVGRVNIDAPIVRATDSRALPSAS